MTCPAGHRSSLQHRAVPTDSGRALRAYFARNRRSLPVLPLPFDAPCRTAQRTVAHEGDETMTTNTATRAHRTTVEERKAEAEALHSSIREQVDRLRNTDRWRRFLEFASSFHDYSLNNVLLILASVRTRPPLPVTGRGRRRAAKSVPGSTAFTSSATASRRLRKPTTTTTNPPRARTLVKRSPGSRS